MTLYTFTFMEGNLAAASAENVELCSRTAAHREAFKTVAEIAAQAISEGESYYTATLIVSDEEGRQIMKIALDSKMDVSVLPTERIQLGTAVASSLD